MSWKSKTNHDWIGLHSNIRSKARNLGCRGPPQTVDALTGFPKANLENGGEGGPMAELRIVLGLGGASVSGTPKIRKRYLPIFKRIRSELCSYKNE